ncbi:MAG: hypothetical protein ACPHQP_11645, partial [Longimicrobiales bacterium]
VPNVSIAVVDQMGVPRGRKLPMVDMHIRSVHLVRVNDAVAPQAFPERAPPTPRRLRLASAREQPEVEGVVMPGVPCRHALNEPRERLRPLRMDKRPEARFADFTDHGER